MYPDRKIPRPKRSPVEQEEDRAWIGFYRRVRSDPVTAAEVLAQLETDPESKRRHLALFLSCRQSLRNDKLRRARNRRAAQALKGCVATLFGVCIDMVMGLSRDGREIALELLPDPRSSSEGRSRSVAQIDANRTDAGPTSKAA